MKLKTPNQQTIDAGKSISVSSGSGFELVCRATDCDVDMNLGRVTIRAKRIKVREVKAS